MAKILIVDDDQMLRKAMSMLVLRAGHEVTCASTLAQGYSTVSSESYDVVMLDVKLPDGSGLDLLPEITGKDHKPEVIIMTADGNPDGAELAIKSGAWDYIEKSSSIKKLMLPLWRALKYRQEKKAISQTTALKRGNIIGTSQKMCECLDLLARAASTDSNVLITGETGTGKELFAHAVHVNSRRAARNFVVVDCTVLPETLVESALFGHNKGSFTGAEKAEEGLIGQAHRGTLFLDEIGELPLNEQRTFLRVLQERCFRPVGGKKEIRCDFRLVAATNRDLDQMVKDRSFREDLLFRLRVLTIELPPLRERLEDIRALSTHYVNKLCERYQMDPKAISSDLFDTLGSYDWPGNVRELVNALEGALALAGDAPKMFSHHLPTDFRILLARRSIEKNPAVKPGLSAGGQNCGSLQKLREFRETMERQYLLDLINVAQGSIKKAMEISGLSKSRLYGILKKHQISGLNPTSPPAATVNPD
jgi:two-component system NtrC family response regulator